MRTGFAEARAGQKDGADLMPRSYDQRWLLLPCRQMPLLPRIFHPMPRSPKGLAPILLVHMVKSFGYHAHLADQLA